MTLSSTRTQQRVKKMTLADYSMLAFALLNSARVVAYFPQMIRVYRDADGAQAVSLSTWVLFAVTNAATVCYALAALNDRVMALVFALNTACCVAIAAMVASKRAHYKWQQSMNRRANLDRINATALGECKAR
jgi:hypothetical protein